MMGKGGYGGTIEYERRDCRGMVVVVGGKKGIKVIEGG